MNREAPAILRCVVERITFRNMENGYTVLKTRVKGYAELVTVVGSLLDVSVGSVLIVAGEWKNDNKYGRQFMASSWEETLPATVYGIEKYLGSGLIKGVGAKFARRIVETFGARTLEVIETEPERLMEVPGIGRIRVDMIIRGWNKQREIKNLMLFLQDHDVSTAHAARIYKTYENESIKVVKENPYRLADEVWGIGFRTADAIAGKLGIEKESYERCRCGLLYSLNKLAEEGHCYARPRQLLEKGAELLGVEEALLRETLERMVKSKDLIVEPGVEADGSDAVYLPPFFFSESGVARKLKGLLNAPRRETVGDVEALIARVQEKSGLTYDRVQLEAIRTAAFSKVMVLTGGPGTGKTTTTNSIIRVYEAGGYEIVLAAPTGRAAKRMTEATGLPARTIHRLLEYSIAGGYKVNESNPLKGDVLIVDECSMIDIILMYNLLKAVPEHMTLILVGDIDQLPSIGPGNVLRDIIASEAVPVVRLERIFRQARGSRIVTNAHRVNKGEFPNITNMRDSDFFFIRDEEPEHVLAQIVPICKRRLPATYNFDPINDIQVLTPMQRGVIGAQSMNRELQQALNPCSILLRRAGTEYRLGDKVMQIRNNYDKGVFNGDIGIISAVDLEERELRVRFDSLEASYDVSELDELVLAYATTIHKAQGSEYPVVVMPVLMTHFVMLQRNLIYTGITRAKKLLVMIGSTKALGYAIGNDKVVQRNTRLAQRLKI